MMTVFLIDFEGMDEMDDLTRILIKLIEIVKNDVRRRFSMILMKNNFRVRINPKSNPKTNPQ